MTESPFRTIDDIETPSTVLVRVDLNSPVTDGIVQDNRRFDRHAETLNDLAATGHRVVVLAHQGRPGRPDCVSLADHAAILESKVAAPVSFCEEIVGPAMSSAVDDLNPGSILLLENVRMHPDELADRSPASHATSDLVSALAAVGDQYVGDAYSTAHRSHASIVGLPIAMDDAVAGRVMEAEYVANSAIQSRSFDGPVTMVLGGTKADDLLRVIEGVGSTVDTFLLGGVIGELCLRAQGYDLGYDIDGSDLFDNLWAEQADTIEALLDATGDRLFLPSDLAYVDPDGQRAERDVNEIEKSTDYLDIGAATIDRYVDHISGSDAVFVKGAVGVFEDERFSHGTVELLQAVADSGAFSVVGGGDTSRVVDMYDLDPDAFDHISIAGGAYVRALAGESLPGVEVLIDAASDNS